MHKLEKHFKKRLVDTTEKSKGNIELQSVNVSEKDKSSKIFVTQQPANTSLADFENTTSNQLVKDYQDFEDEFQLHDNDMSKIKMSRNAKILMTKSKDQITGVDRSYKINPVYNLPPGEEIRNDEMNVEDFDEDDNSILKILKSKKGALNKIASVFGKKRSNSPLDDSAVFGSKSVDLTKNNTCNNINKQPIKTSNSNVEGKHKDEESKMHLGINKEESHESSSVSNRSSSRKDYGRKDSNPRLEKTLDKMRKQLDKARHKIDERVQRRIEMFNNLQNEANENKKWKPKKNAENNVKLKRTSFVAIEEMENEDKTIENKDLSINFDECLESIDQ